MKILLLYRTPLIAGFLSILLWGIIHQFWAIVYYYIHQPIVPFLGYTFKFCSYFILTYSFVRGILIYRKGKNKLI